MNVDRRVGRMEFLKLAAVAGSAAFVSGCSNLPVVGGVFSQESGGKKEGSGEYVENNQGKTVYMPKGLSQEDKKALMDGNRFYSDTGTFGGDFTRWGSDSCGLGLFLVSFAGFAFLKRRARIMGNKKDSGE